MAFTHIRVRFRVRVRVRVRVDVPTSLVHGSGDGGVGGVRVVVGRGDAVHRPAVRDHEPCTAVDETSYDSHHRTYACHTHTHIHTDTDAHTHRRTRTHY